MKKGYLRWAIIGGVVYLAAFYFFLSPLGQGIFSGTPVGWIFYPGIFLSVLILSSGFLDVLFGRFPLLATVYAVTCNFLWGAVIGYIAHAIWLVIASPNSKR